MVVSEIKKRLRVPRSPISVDVCVCMSGLGVRSLYVNPAMTWVPQEVENGSMDSWPLLVKIISFFCLYTFSGLFLSHDTYITVPPSS